MAEADSPDYWISASKDGNREQHYRGQLRVMYCLSTGGCVFDYGGRLVALHCSDLTIRIAC